MKKNTPRLAFDLGDAKWVKCAKAPSEKEVAKKPIGTIFFYRGNEKTSVYVKVEDASAEHVRPWRHANRRLLASAIAQIEQIDERNAKRPDDYEWMSDDYGVASSLKGNSVMTGTIGVARRVPRARIDVKKIVIIGAAWGPARISAVNPAAADLGKAFRVIITTKQGPQAMVYVKIDDDDWICASTAIDVDEAAEIMPRLREDVKYPRYQRMRDKEIRESIEFHVNNGGVLATTTIAVTF